MQRGRSLGKEQDLDREKNERGEGEGEGYFFWGGRESRDRAAIELAAILDARATGKLGREKSVSEGGRGWEKRRKQPARKLGF